MKKNNAFNDFVKPILVLFCICIAVAALLGYVNSITAPIIEENARIKAEETRAAVLSGAQSFTEIECDTETLGIDSVYKEDGGLGYVITASYKGYGGYVTVTVGLDPEGTVVGMNADVSTETSGIGSKAGEPAYAEKYLGISGSADAVDTITGATYSSTAVKTGVNAALAAFDSVKGE